MMRGIYFVVGGLFNTAVDAMTNLVAFALLVAVVAPIAVCIAIAYVFVLFIAAAITGLGYLMGER